MLKREVRSAGRYFTALAKWLLCAAFTGAVGGVAGSAFHKSVDWAAGLRAAHPWIVWLLPVGGLAIVALYRLAGVRESKGTNLVIQAVRSDERPPLRMTPLIFAGTVITHLVGGSSGREGAALQIGGSLGNGIGELFRMDQKDLRAMTMCGMSAVFAAVFGTPVTAAVFSIEVVSVGILQYSALVPCVVGALTGYGVAGLFGLEPVRFALAALPDFGAVSCAQVVGLSALCAAVSILFCEAMHAAGFAYKKLIPNGYLRAAVGGGIVLGLTLLVGGQTYNGAGMETVAAAVAGNAMPWAFVLKLVFTALTLGAGFKGGEIVPAFFVGSTFGCVVGALLGLPAGFGAAIGLASLFCGVVNCPIASMLLSFELFGGAGLPFFALACAVSYLMSGYHSLYSTQKFAVSKLRAEMLDDDVK